MIVWCFIPDINLCQQLFWNWEKVNFLNRLISKTFCLLGLLNSRQSSGFLRVGTKRAPLNLDPLLDPIWTPFWTPFWIPFCTPFWTPYIFLPKNTGSIQSVGKIWNIMNSRGVVNDIREFTKTRRRRWGQRRLKNEFIFYLPISWYSKVIRFVYHCQNYRKTKSGTQR